MPKKFSPGPWIALSDGTISAPEQWTVFADEDPEHKAPAFCQGPRARANARLIAAAPDLYAACEALIYPDKVKGKGDHLQVAIDRARAALEKAGRSKK